MKLCILLSAYNEEENIERLIKNIYRYALDIIVVDDGSSDNTARIAEATKAIVLKHEKNLGKGQALRTGFKYIIERAYEGVILMDADGQHCPEEINNFIQHARTSEAGIIVGSRMHHPKGMPWVRKITNLATSYMLSRIIGYKIPDTQCGFRFVKTEVLKKINLSTGKYEIESEMLIEAAKNNFHIESIPIKSIYEQQKSKINPLVDTFRFFRLIGKTLFFKKQ